MKAGKLTSVRVEAELWAAWKTKAVAERTTMRKILEQMLRHYLREWLPKTQTVAPLDTQEGEGGE